MGDMVSYLSNGATNEGYLAVPEAGNGAAVVVIQQWWGLANYSGKTDHPDAARLAWARTLEHFRSRLT